MYKLSETLKELLAERNLNNSTFAVEVGISSSRITDYIKNDELPTVKNLIKIANYFNCSTDFLLGREYEQQHGKFNEYIPLDKRLPFLLDYFGISHKEIYENDGITKSRYFDWLSGKRKPSLDNIIKLADILGCSVDFILGRED